MNKIKCKGCGEIKNENEYSRHPYSKNGYLGKCKKCSSLDSLKRYYKYRQNPEWMKKQRERAIEKYYRLGHKITDKKRAGLKEWEIRYPEKRKAHWAVKKVLKKKGFCLHHWSYNDEHIKNVIELTPIEHHMVHRYTIYDPERKMYRTKDGELIDTFERAIKYYNYLRVLENKPFKKGGRDECIRP